MVGPSPTGSWTGNAGKVAEFTIAGWAMITAPAGHGVSIPDGRVYEKVSGSYVEKIALDVQSGKWLYGDDAGSAGSLVVTLTPAPAAYVKGMCFSTKLAAAIPGATVCNVNGLGAKTVVNGDGSALVLNQYPAGALVGLEYDGTNLQLVWGSAGALELNSPVFNTIIQSSAGVFPEIATGNNKFTATISTGQLVIDTGQTWLWRGLVPFSTTSFSSGDRTFATAANKTYHLRWHSPGFGDATPAATYPKGRFVLRDLADAGYNPSAVDERSGSFDTKVDDMLIARVVTNGSNALTVTWLKNRRLLFGDVSMQKSSTRTTSAGGEFIHVTDPFELNWSRTPSRSGSLAMVEGSISNGGRDIRTIIGAADSLVSQGDGSGTVYSEGSRYVLRPIGHHLVGAVSTSLSLTCAGTFILVA